MTHSPVGTTVRMEGGVYCTDRRSYYRYLLFVPGTAPVCRRYDNVRLVDLEGTDRSFNSVSTGSTVQTNRKKRPLEELAREFDMIFPICILRL